MFAQIYQALVERGVDPATAEVLAGDIEIRLSDDRMGQAREALAMAGIEEGEIDRRILLSDNRMEQAREAWAQRRIPEPVVPYQLPETTNIAGIREPDRVDLRARSVGPNVGLAPGLDVRPDVADSLPRAENTPININTQPPLRREPPGPRRTFVSPADEDPTQFADLFDLLLKDYSPAGSDRTITQKPSELGGWANRLDDSEMRALWAPVEANRRTDSTDDYNNVVDEAIEAAAARRQRVGANIFIWELVDALPAGGEELSPDSRFDANGFNHLEHIYAFNEFVFGRQIDMAALLRGESIEVGDIELSDGYVIPDVVLSSVEDYVDLQEQLADDIGEGGFDVGSFFKGVADLTTGVAAFNGFQRLREVFGDRFGENEARDLFEIPLDWMLLYDPEIDSSDAANDEYEALDTTLTQLGSTRGEDVGGGLIRAGYTDRLEVLDPTNYGPDREIIKGAQAQIGAVQPPGEAPLQVAPDAWKAYEDVLSPEAMRGEGYAGNKGAGVVADPAQYDVLQEYLQDMYGGFSFFFDLEAEKLMVGLNKFDKPVEAGSADAVRDVHILDYLTGNYPTQGGGKAGQITSRALVLEAIETTEWYLTTNTSMREWEGKYGADPFARFSELGRGNQMDRVGDIYDALSDAADALMGAGAAERIGEERLIMLAAEVDYLGYDTDDVTQRQMLVELISEAEQPWQAANADFAAFRLQRDAVEALARDFYLPLTDARRDEYAEKLFTGEMSAEEVGAQMRTQALARYGESNQVTNALTAGLTMRDYFDPYVADMERILDRPVDLFEEFPEVIEMVPGDGPARPMSYAEFGEYVRGLPEWGQSDQGQDTARGLVNAIGALFGEVA
jgi:hypothetical protein